MLETLVQFTQLPENWDTYGGGPTSTQAIATSLDVLQRLLTKDSTAPVIVPTQEGGVQFEWYRAPGDELEIRVGPTGHISVFRVNEQDGVLTEQENVSIDELPMLVSALVGTL